MKTKPAMRSAYPHGPIEPLHRTYKYLRPRNALVILALAVLAWVPIAWVLS